MTKIGRPSKIDEKIIVVEKLHDEDVKVEKTIGDYVIELIEIGHDVEDVCDEATITPATYYSWMHRGRDAAAKAGEGHDLTEDDERFLEFLLSAQRARGSLRRRLEKRIHDLVPGMEPREVTDTLARLAKMKWSKASTVSIDLNGQLVVESHGEAITQLLRVVIDGLIGIAPEKTQVRMREAAPQIVQEALASVVEPSA